MFIGSSLIIHNRNKLCLTWEKKYWKCREGVLPKIEREKKKKTDFTKKQEPEWFLQLQQRSSNNLETRPCIGRAPGTSCLGVLSCKTQIPGEEPLPDWSHFGRMVTSWLGEAGHFAWQSLHGDIQSTIGELLSKEEEVDIGQQYQQLTVTFFLLSATIRVSMMTPIWWKGRVRLSKFKQAAQGIWVENLPEFRAQ